MGHLVLQKDASIPAGCAAALQGDHHFIRGGLGMLLCIGKNGQVASWAGDKDVALRDQYWAGMQDVSVSRFVPGLVIGLQKDGACMIGKRGLRQLTGPGMGNVRPFDAINSGVRALSGVRQVSAGDAFFACGEDGQVRFVPVFMGYGRAYGRYMGWRDVRQLVAQQDLVLAVTDAGQVLTDGANACRLPPEDADVVCACALGTDYKTVVCCTRDGALFYGEHRLVLPQGERVVKVDGAMHIFVALTEQGNLYVYEWEQQLEAHTGRHFQDVTVFQAQGGFPVFWAALEE